MKILVSYRGIPESPGWATGDMVVKAFRSLGHEVAPYARYYQTKDWVTGRPALDPTYWDLMVFMECNDPEPQYPELKLVASRKTACWLFDTSYFDNRLQHIVKYFNFDHIFLANPLTIQEYQVWGYDNVHYLPYACDRELHGRSLEDPKTRDVVLVGSIRDDRTALAHTLARRGVDLELVGGIFREEYIDALASSKIVVNQNPTNGRGLLNMRFWEAQAAGAYVITESEDLAANAAMISPCIAGGYRSIDDLATQCQSLLNGTDASTAMLNALLHSSQEHAFAHHTYVQRCEKILKTVFPDERN